MDEKIVKKLKYDIFQEEMKSLIHNNNFNYKVTSGPNKTEYTNVIYDKGVYVLSNSENRIIISLESFIIDILPYYFEIKKYHLSK